MKIIIEIKGTSTFKKIIELGEELNELECKFPEVIKEINREW